MGNLANEASRGRLQTRQTAQRISAVRWIPHAPTHRGMMNDASFLEHVTSVSLAKRQPSWEIVRGGNSFAICIANDHYAEDFRLPFAPESDILSLRFVRSGELVLQSAGGEVSVSANTACLYKAVSGEIYDLVIKKERPLQSVTFHFPAERFIEEVGLNSQDLPQTFHDILALPQTVQASLRMTGAMNEAVMSMFVCDLAGNLRRKYMIAKAVELICLLTDEIGCRVEDSRLLEHGLLKHKDRFLMAREILDEKPTRVPAVDTIAKRVGLNRTTLRKGFKVVFGVSLSNYARDQLMKIARNLLLDRKRTISEISIRLGYEHHTNFTAAFKKYHGYSPRSFREFGGLEENSLPLPISRLGPLPANGSAPHRGRCTSSSYTARIETTGSSL